MRYKTLNRCYPNHHYHVSIIFYPQIINFVLACIIIQAKIHVRLILLICYSLLATPSAETTKESGHLFSAFKGLSVKMMMMDQANNYIFTPLAEIFNEVY